MQTGLFCRRGEMALAVVVWLSWVLGAGVMAAPSEGIGESTGEEPTGGTGGSDGDETVIEPFGTNLTGDLASRLQALAFGIGAFDTTTGMVTVKRTTDSWFTVDRNTGAFTLVKPGCADGTGTITTMWNGNELDVTLVGQMCSFEGTLIAVDFGLTLAVGPQAGEVQFKLDGDSTVMVQNVGRLIIVADIEGAHDRPADVAIDWLGSWNDLLGMASVMEATLSGTQIYHPDYVPPPPPPPSG